MQRATDQMTMTVRRAAPTAAVYCTALTSCAGQLPILAAGSLDCARCTGVSAPACLSFAVFAAVGCAGMLSALLALLAAGRVAAAGVSGGRLVARALVKNLNFARLVSCMCSIFVKGEMNLCKSSLDDWRQMPIISCRLQPQSEGLQSVHPACIRFHPLFQCKEK